MKHVSLDTVFYGMLLR